MLEIQMDPSAGGGEDGKSGGDYAFEAGSYFRCFCFRTSLWN